MQEVLGTSVYFNFITYPLHPKLNSFLRRTSAAPLFGIARNQATWKPSQSELDEACVICEIF